MLKFAIVCLMLALSASKSQGQLARGSILAGGNISFSAIRNVNNGQFTGRTTTFQFSPVAGYFLIDQLAAGLRLTYNYYGNNNIVSGTNNRSSSHELGLGPFARYYFLPESRKVNWLTELSYVFSSIKTVVGTTSTTRFNTVNVLAGPAVFLNRNVALELLAGYRRQNVSDNNFTGHSFQFQAGFQFYPGKWGKK